MIVNNLHRLFLVIVLKKVSFEINDTIVFQRVRITLGVDLHQMLGIILIDKTNMNKQNQAHVITPLNSYILCYNIIMSKKY